MILIKMLDRLRVYKNKKILVTGNTGFKGPWLSLFLKNLGAEVFGFSDDIYWDKGIFSKNNISCINQHWGDIRNYNELIFCIIIIKMEIIK